MKFAEGGPHQADAASVAKPYTPHYGPREAESEAGGPSFRELRKGGVFVSLRKLRLHFNLVRVRRKNRTLAKIARVAAPEVQDHSKAGTPAHRNKI